MMSTMAESFNDVLAATDLDRLERIVNECTEQEFLSALSRTGNKTSIEDFCRLISLWGNKHIEAMARKSNMITRHRFGKVVNLYAPVYISSYCNCNCVYCGFSYKKKIERKRLTMDEIIREVKLIKSRGVQHVLLVAGTDPGLLNDDFIFKVINECHRLVPSVSIEVEPFNVDVYSKMVDHGLDGLVIYQETYNREIYEKLHLAGEKKNYFGRIDKLEQGARSGLRRVGLGVLLGLAPWKKDLISLAMNLEYLIKKYWKVLFTVSLPRFQPAGVDFNPEHCVDDTTFTQLICALRIAFHDTPFYLSTRENRELRDGLVHCGVTHLSAGSKTAPGGYGVSVDAEGQFDTDDTRSTEEIVAMLKASGLDPVWKDWEGVLND